MKTALEKSLSPILLTEVELSEAIPGVCADHPTSPSAYTRLQSLIRLHGQPLGILNLRLTPGGLTPLELAALIWDQFAPDIRAHLEADGISPPRALEASGLGPASCLLDQPLSSLDEPLISVAIATVNRTESLLACVMSLLAMDYSNYEVLIVHNGPLKEGTEEALQRIKALDPRIRLVYEAQPGLANAHNRALESARAKLIAITDDDVVVDRSWLRVIARTFLAYPQAGCVTGLIRPTELETSSQIWIEQFGGFGKGYRQKVYNLGSNRPLDPLFPLAAGKFGSGANMAFRRDALECMGGFDPALGAGSLALGGDDLAAFYSVIDEGFQLIYEPAAIVHHRHHRSYQDLRRVAFGYGVGLGAYLTKVFTRHPGQLLRRLLSGIHYYFSPRSGKNLRKEDDYPQDLKRQELRGLISGPAAYFRSRQSLRRRSTRRGPQRSDRSRLARSD